MYFITDYKSRKLIDDTLCLLLQPFYGVNLAKKKYVNEIALTCLKKPRTSPEATAIKHIFKVSSSGISVLLPVSFKLPCKDIQQCFVSDLCNFRFESKRDDGIIGGEMLFFQLEQ